MADFGVRQACSADCDTIAALWHESWHDAHRDLVPADILAERTLSSFAARLVPLLGDTLVALAALRGSTATIGGFVTIIANEIDQLYVARALRGMGCADALMAAAEKRLIDEGVDDAVIQCAAGNHRALAFYLRQGYSDTGVRQMPMWRQSHLPDVTMPTHLLVKRLG